MAKMGSQVSNGKAFEFACIDELGSVCKSRGVQVTVVQDAPYLTAKNAFSLLDVNHQSIYRAGAHNAMAFIFDCEPNLFDQKLSTVVVLSIQADSAGKAGDVRDILIKREVSLKRSWECGVSCKHNHDAVKHPRLNLQPPKDLFAGAWTKNFTMDKLYFTTCNSIVTSYHNDFVQKRTWNDVFPNNTRSTKIYQPINEAIIESLLKYKNNEAFVGELFSFLIGTHDYYKVEMMEGLSVTNVTTINLNNDLGAPSPNKVVSPIQPIRLLKPTRIIEIYFKKNSLSTFYVVFDNCWVLSFRLHSADSKMSVTGLKYDVRFEGSPEKKPLYPIRW